MGDGIAASGHSDPCGVISGVRTTPVAVPLTRPMVYAGGSDAVATQIVVEVETTSGLTGLGEAVAGLSPTVVEAALNHVGQALIGHPARDVRGLRRLYDYRWRYQPALMNLTLCPFDMALWDIKGKASGVPVHDLLGGSARSEVDHFFWIHRRNDDITDPDVLAQVERGLAAGSTVFSLRVGLEETDDHTVRLVETVREALGPSKKLRLDANQAWTPGQAIGILRKLAPCSLDWVEEPIIGSDLRTLRRIRDITGTAICIDQGAYLPRDIARVAASRAADVVCTDPSRLGGLLAFTEAAALLELSSIAVSRHCGAELGIFLAASLQACSVLPNLALGNQHLADLLSFDVIRENLAHPSGRFPVPDGPGLGITLDRDRLAEAHENHVRSD
jgi:L-alanine-DL-glutamate epimerase-like enolase superfamily enzyme